MSGISVDGKAVVAGLLIVAHANYNRTETVPGRPIAVKDEEIFKQWQRYYAFLEDAGEKRGG